MKKNFTSSIPSGLGPPGGSSLSGMPGGLAGSLAKPTPSGSASSSSTSGPTSYTSGLTGLRPAASSSASVPSVSGITTGYRPGGITATASSVGNYASSATGGSTSFTAGGYGSAGTSSSSSSSIYKPATGSSYTPGAITASTYAAPPPPSAYTAAAAPAPPAAAGSSSLDAIPEEIIPGGTASASSTPAPSVYRPPSMSAGATASVTTSSYTYAGSTATNPYAGSSSSVTAPSYLPPGKMNNYGGSVGIAKATPVVGSAPASSSTSAIMVAPPGSGLASVPSSGVVAGGASAVASSSSAMTLQPVSSSVSVGGVVTAAAAVPDKPGDDVKDRGKLLDFKVRTPAQKGLQPGKLKQYIEAPLSDTMSWPPQSAEVKKDLRKYLLKKKISNKSLVTYDVAVTGNARVEGTYHYKEKVIPATDPKKKPQHKRWYQHATRKVMLSYDASTKKWTFSERRVLLDGDASAPASPDMIVDQTTMLSASPSPRGGPSGTNSAGQQRKKVKYGPLQVMCSTSAAEERAEFISDTAQWFDDYGNLIEPQIVITPKAKEMKTGTGTASTGKLSSPGDARSKSRPASAKPASTNATSRQRSLSASKFKKINDKDLSPSARLRNSKELIAADLDSIPMLSTKKKRPQSAGGSGKGSMKSRSSEAAASTEFLTDLEKRMRKLNLSKSAQSRVDKVKKNLLDDCAKFVAKILEAQALQEKDAATGGEQGSKAKKTSKNSDTAASKQKSQLSSARSEADAAKAGTGGTAKNKSSSEDEDPFALAFGKFGEQKSSEQTGNAQVFLPPPLDLAGGKVVVAKTAGGEQDGTATGERKGDEEPATAREKRKDQMYEQHYLKAEKHEMKQEYTLAVREYKEALRIKPQDANAQNRLNFVERAFLKEKPVKGMLRFVSHYNLSLRYWDKGKATLAIKECENAITILKNFGLPMTGLIDVLDKMQVVHEGAKFREQKLEDQLAFPRNEAKKPELHYRLGVLYFDKRMFDVARKEMQKAETSMKQRGYLTLHQKASPETCMRVREQLEGIRDDLDVLAVKQRRFCLEAPGSMSIATSAFGSKETAISSSSAELGEMEYLFQSQQQIASGVPPMRDSLSGPQMLPDFCARFQGDIFGDDEVYPVPPAPWVRELLGRSDLDWQF
ncbi:unnamed protein product [Amoebophrya sp. A120]|nr:unnamed protein product [Amoebophrya sp. A120]|eukprot:GSA120T00018761001.1